MRAGESDDERRKCEEEERRRNEAQPAGGAVDEIRQEREVREGACSTPPAVVPRAPQQRKQRHDGEQGERERVLKAHRRPPRNAANGRSQSPVVERTRCGTPIAVRTRSTPVRSSAAAAA